MNKTTRNHIRALLWNYKEISKSLKQISEIVLNNRINFTEYPLSEENNYALTMNQMIFNKIFLDVVDSVLEDSTSEVKDIFTSKYLYGYPTKENNLVSCEVALSESTIKRRDSELLREIAMRLGWN